MTTDPSGFSDVDQREDAERFVAILAAQDRMPGIAGIRAASRAMLRARKGDHILDAGCGIGTEARALAEGGIRVTAIDISERMLDIARATTPPEATIAFARGDVLALDADDDAFDGARSERVLQHLTDPAAALSELIRVVRPGGRVVVLDTDWTSCSVDLPDEGLVEVFRMATASNFTSPTVGRRLYGMFARAGLDDVAVEGHPVILRAPTLPDSDVNPVEITIGAALSRATLTPEQAERISAHIARATTEGAFLMSLMMYVVGGTVPKAR